MGHYLYGLVPEDAVAPTEPGVGGGGVSIHRVGDGLGVLRSGFDGPSIQPRRAHLAAHDRILAATMAAGAVLPFRFGMIAGDLDVVSDDLDVAAVHERLRALSGKAEIQVLWEPAEDTSVRRVADRHPEVLDRTIAAVDRGRMVVDGVGRLAVEDLSAIVDEVRYLTDAVAAIESRGMSARVAVLIDAGRVDDLISITERLADRAAPAGTLRTVGALPPYSFTDLDREPVGA